MDVLDLEEDDLLQVEAVEEGFLIDKIRDRDVNVRHEAVGRGPEVGRVGWPQGLGGVDGRCRLLDGFENVDAAEEDLRTRCIIEYGAVQACERGVDASESSLD